MVDLDVFIKQVIIDIVSTSIALSNELGRDIHLSSLSNSAVEFDLAVGIEKTSSNIVAGSIAIKILNLGRDNKNEVKELAVQRIKFAIYVSSLSHIEQNKIRSINKNGNM